MSHAAPSPFQRSGPDALVLHLLQSMVSAGRSDSTVAAQQKMHDLLAGIKKYQTCGVPPIPREHAVIWQQGPVRLLQLKTRAQKTPARGPIVLIPSLVNGWEILDLLPQQSFAWSLQQSGFDVHIVDWGDVRSEPKIETLENVLLDYLAPMVRGVAALAARPVAVMGYCMGGLLMAGAMPEMREAVSAQVYLATPWDFHAGDPHLTRLVRAWAPGVLPLLHTGSYLPNTQVQMLFAQVDPEMAIQKFSRFYRMATNDRAARNFVAVEDWLQTGRDLPRGIALTCIQDWYLDNKPGYGAWQVGPHKITLDALGGIPALVVAPAQDRLVETQTAQALAGIKGARLLTPDIGHIGMMASPRARACVWEPILGWLTQV